MAIWIRSQDKTSLIECKKIDICERQDKYEFIANYKYYDGDETYDDLMILRKLVNKATFKLMTDKNKLITELDKLDCISNINDYTNNCNSHDDIISTINEAFEDEGLCAEEMFGELGYKLIKNTPYLIYKRDDGGYITMLSFIDTGKRIFIEEYEEYNDNQPQGTTVIYMDTLKAINQQCNELGWL